jgi:hypothetical protein
MKMFGRGRAFLFAAWLIASSQIALAGGYGGAAAGNGFLFNNANGFNQFDQLGNLFANNGFFNNNGVFNNCVFDGQVFMNNNVSNLVNGNQFLGSGFGQGFLNQNGLGQNFLGQNFLGQNFLGNDIFGGLGGFGLGAGVLLVDQSGNPVRVASDGFGNMIDSIGQRFSVPRDAFGNPLDRFGNFLKVAQDASGNALLISTDRFGNIVRIPTRNGQVIRPIVTGQFNALGANQGGLGANGDSQAGSTGFLDVFSSDNGQSTADNSNQGTQRLFNARESGGVRSLRGASGIGIPVGGGSVHGGGDDGGQVIQRRLAE